MSKKSRRRAQRRAIVRKQEAKKAEREKGA